MHLSVRKYLMSVRYSINEQVKMRRNIHECLLSNVKHAKQRKVETLWNALSYTHHQESLVNKHQSKNPNVQMS